MNDPFRAAWTIDEHDYPADGGPEQVLRFALRYAILAPSGHNGQPWAFSIVDGTLQVRADRSRALPTIDPHDRELLIACAATIHLTTLVLQHFGHQPTVTLLPDPADPDLLATIHPGATGATPPGRELFDAITRRHSNRHPYRTQPLDPAALDRLHDAAAAHGAWLHPIVDPATIAAAADLIATGDRIKWCEPAFRHELAERVIPNRGPRRDGMPAGAFGAPGPLARLAPTAIRHLDLGRMRAAADNKLATASPLLAVIGTGTDDPAAWLAAGQAMSHVLLQATADGLATSFLSQAIEVPQLRPRLAAVAGCPGWPQLLLRVGYPRRRARLAPRRPVAEVLTASGHPAATERSR